MKRRNLILTLFTLGIAVAAILLIWRLRLAQSGAPADSQQDFGLVRMQQVMAKARRGEKIVIGGIGGSITEGYTASVAAKRYLTQVYDWWDAHFPGQVTLINAGIGATGSGLGVHRAEDDLLSKNPDFVIIEFAVNDLGAPQRQQTLEGLIRKMLNQPNQPAVLLLYFMMKNGASTQADFAPLAEHYRLPQVSYADRVQQLVREGKITLEDIFADDYHPNNLGHTYAAAFVIETLDTVYNNLPAQDANIPAPAALPPPLFSDVFEHTRCLHYDNFQPTMQGNWNKGRLDKSCGGGGWLGNDAGAELTFPNLEGTTFGVGVRVQRNRDFGIAEVWVDDGPHVKIDSYLPLSAGSWGGPVPNFTLVAENLSAGPHTLHVRILDEKNPEASSSQKHSFELMSVFVDGVPATP
jgi:lysophospholipase L1-like esterase